MEEVIKLPEAEELGGKRGDPTDLSCVDRNLGIEELASATVPFLEIDGYYREENPSKEIENEDDAVESVTNKSTPGGNYFRYPYPYKIQDIKERLKRGQNLYKDVLYRHLRNDKLLPPSFYRIFEKLFRPDVNVDDFD